MSQTNTLATADIVVVGAGIVGLSTAWELQKRGFSVVVVEQRFPGYGSSGRNAGAVWLQTRRRGLELELARAGRDKYSEYLDVVGDVFDLRRDGGLFFFETESQGAIMESYVRDRREAGLKIEMVGRSEAADISPILPETAIGAAFCSDDAQVDSLSFINALESACLRKGVLIFRNCSVLSTLRRGDAVVGVQTVRGEIHGSGVVWATGAWAVILRAEGIDLPIETSRIGQLMTQPIEIKPSPPLHGPRGVHSCGGLLDLAEFDADAFPAPVIDELPESQQDFSFDDTISLNHGGSLYVGHSIDGRGALNPHISLHATRAMTSVAMDRFRRYAEFGVTGLWAGLGSETPDQLPIVGQMDGAFVNVGHMWGVASGPVCGQVLAEQVAGESTEFSAGLSPDRSSVRDQVV
jgi:glycine/D-amino acid oxidase-like deaminating enzyme